MSYRAEWNAPDDERNALAMEADELRAKITAARAEAAELRREAESRIGPAGWTVILAVTGLIGLACAAVLALALLVALSSLMVWKG